MASLSRLAPMASLSKPNGNFIKAPERPFYRRLSNGHFIKAKPNGEFIKANPIAVLSRQALTTQLITANWPLYQSQWPFYQGLQFSSKVAAAQLDFSSGGPIQYCAAQAIYQRTIAVSSRQAVTTLVYRSQWPLYQSQWPFYQGRPILAKEEFRGKNLWV